MENPYGAVPASLSDASKNLIALSHSYLEGKKLEQDLSLAKMKAETETAIIGANMERDHLTHAKDMAHMDMLNEHFNKNYALQAAAKDFHQNVEFPVTKTHVEASNKLMGAQAQELAYKSQKDTLGNWVAKSGIDPEIVKILNPNLNRVYTREEALRLEDQIKPYIPSLGMGVEHAKIKAIEAALKNPATIPDQIPALEKQYNDSLTRVQTYQALLKGFSGHDKINYITKVQANGGTVEQATEDWGKIEAGMKKIQDAQSHLNSSPDAFNVLRTKISIDPLYDENIANAHKVIDALAPPELQKGIIVGYKYRVDKGDYEGAHAYLCGHAYQLQNKKTKAAAAEAGGDFDRFPVGA